MRRLGGLCRDSEEYAANKRSMSRSGENATLYESALGIRGEGYYIEAVNRAEWVLTNLDLV